MDREEMPVTLEYMDNVERQMTKVTVKAVTIFIPSYWIKTLFLTLVLHHSVYVYKGLGCFEKVAK